MIVCMFEALSEEEKKKEEKEEEEKGSNYLESTFYSETSLLGLNYFGIRTPTLKE